MRLFRFYMSTCDTSLPFTTIHTSRKYIEKEIYNELNTTKITILRIHVYTSQELSLRTLISMLIKAKLSQLNW